MILIDSHIVHKVFPKSLDSIGIKLRMLKALLTVINVLHELSVTLEGFLELGLFLQLMK
jgi:hypothetical protein